MVAILKKNSIKYQINICANLRSMVCIYCWWIAWIKYCWNQAMVYSQMMSVWQWKGVFTHCISGLVLEGDGESTPYFLKWPPQKKCQQEYFYCKMYWAFSTFRCPPQNVLNSPTISETIGSCAYMNDNVNIYNWIMLMLCIVIYM